MIASDRLQLIEQVARRYGAANCWTADTGTLAGFIVELLHERRELVANLSQAQDQSRRNTKIIARLRARIASSRPSSIDLNKVRD